MSYVYHIMSDVRTILRELKQFFYYTLVNTEEYVTTMHINFSFKCVNMSKKNTTWTAVMMTINFS